MQQRQSSYTVAGRVQPARRRFTRSGWLFAAAVSPLLVSGRGPAVWAQESAPAMRPAVLRTEFRTGQDGWQATGTSGKATQSLDTTTGRGILTFDYTVGKGELNLLSLPTPEKSLAAAHSFRFSVKADQPTTMAAVMQEHDGGRYIALFSAPGGKWQDVTLSTTDFQLSESPGDPKDPDGKLDMDRVDGFTLVDVAEIFSQTDNADLKSLFGIKDGPRSFAIGPFTASEDPIASASFVSRSDPRLDTFLEPQANWIGLAGVSLGVVHDTPIAGRGLKVVYTQTSGKVAGIARQIPKGRLAGQEKLRLNIASVHPATLVVQVEERDGGKYNTILTVDGRKSDSDPIVAKDYTLPFSQFKPSDDSKDPDGKLDLGQVYQIVLVDISGMAGAPSAENALWIGDLRTVAPVAAAP